MPSPDEIAGLALDMIGETREASLADNTSDGRKLKRGYDTTLASILSGYPWKFARQRAQLAAISTPIVSTVWTYHFELPADCLQPLRINEDDRLEWQREGDELFANVAGPLLLEYTRLVVDPGLWPGAFTTAFITLLGSVYAGTFKHDYGVVKELRNLYLTVDLAEAKTQDARARSIVQIRVPTLTTDSRIF